ncbi:MAG: methylenetetrahydrofolate reductase [Candidatus Korarchaeum sp.]|nr:methylenetetrahydrofolate reductase [Candidatus Korarchaeum sp.]MDW8035818.1 methylenetetrahydrofolate reductase [Candidatus Korarchaeum sp.]
MELGVEVVPLSFQKFLRSISSVIGYFDFVSIPECPFGKLMPSSLVLSVVARGFGVKAVPNYRVMDRSELGFLSEMIALSEIGIRRIVIVRGDLPSIGLPTHLNPVSAIKLLKEHGIRMEIGVTSPVKPTESLKAKIEAGADFVVTQPIQSEEEVVDLIDLLEGTPLYVMVMLGIEELDARVLRDMGINEVKRVDYRELIRELERSSKVKGVIISSPKGISKAIELLR